MKKISKKVVDIDFYKIFKPELTPKRMMELGVFGGSYFGLNVKEFPFRIGRQEDNDVLGINDLMLHDSVPYQVSPHHLLISLRNNTIEISDRGSRYGSLINGVRVGLSNRSKVVDLKKGDNEVILGDIYSKIRFNFSEKIFFI